MIINFDINFDTTSTNKRDGQALIALLSVLCGRTDSNLPAPAPKNEQEAIFGVPLQSEPVTAVTAVSDNLPTGPTLVQSDPVPTAETTTRKRRTKAEMAADAAAQADRPPTTGDQLMAAEAARKAAAAEAAQATTATPAAQAVNGAAKLSADELRALLNGYIARHSMEEAIEKLRAFGCNRVTEALALEAVKLNELAATLNG